MGGSEVLKVVRKVGWRMVAELEGVATCYQWKYDKRLARRGSFRATAWKAAENVL
jgi:hypothetical protein